MEAHALTIAHPAAPRAEVGPVDRSRSVGWLFAGTGITLFAVMGLLGLAMRLTQADVVEISDAWFYRLMTLHGAGMLTGALLAMMGGLWFVLRESVTLSLARMMWCFALLVGGAVAVVVAVVLGGFATGWTFLSPLPFLAAGEWSDWAAGFFFVGLALVGIGFMVFCIDVLQATTGAYGGLGGALGLGVLRGRTDSAPPPQVIGATVVSLEGLLASAVGTTVLLALLGRLIDSGVQIDALWAKNLTYFFGHSIANLIIYLAAGMVYVLVPRYAGRPWKTTKPLVIGWLATLVLVATAYSHHLYMDFVQPGFAQYVSTTASFAAALPVAVVTIFTGMMLVWGSRYRWTLASTLLYLGFAGWAIGGTGAVIDSIIPLNFRLHNSLWVPAHFHTYLMLGVIFWVMAFLAHLLERAADRPASRFTSRAAPALMVVGGYGLVGAWYVSGALGVPRRYAAHFGDTAVYSLAGSLFALVFAAGFTIVLAEFALLAREGLRRRRAEGVRTAPQAMPHEPEPAARPASAPLSPIATPIQLAVGVAAATVAVVALLPPIVDASEASAQFHHLDHTGQFLFGALWAFVIGSSPAFFTRMRRSRPGLALAAVIVAPAVMLFAMTPTIYAGLEEPEGLHGLYHLGLVALGVVTGLAAARMGRVPGRVLLVLSVGMAAMYAAGVTGG